VISYYIRTAWTPFIHTPTRPRSSPDDMELKAFLYCSIFDNQQVDLALWICNVILTLTSVTRVSLQLIGFRDSVTDPHI